MVTPVRWKVEVDGIVVFVECDSQKKLKLFTRDGNREFIFENSNLSMMRLFAKVFSEIAENFDPKNDQNVFRIGQHNV